MHASMFGGGGTCLSQSAVRMNGEWPQYQVSTGRCPLVVASCPTTPSPSPSPLLGTAQSPRSPVGIKHQLSHHSSMLCVKLVPVVTIFTTYLKIKKCCLMIHVNVCHSVQNLPQVGSNSTS